VVAGGVVAAGFAGAAGAHATNTDTMSIARVTQTRINFVLDI
jgi:hypothetical protein